MITHLVIQAYAWGLYARVVGYYTEVRYGYISWRTYDCQVCGSIQYSTQLHGGLCNACLTREWAYSHSHNEIDPLIPGEPYMGDI